MPLELRISLRKIAQHASSSISLFRLTAFFLLAFNLCIIRTPQTPAVQKIIISTDCHLTKNILVLSFTDNIYTEYI